MMVVDYCYPCSKAHSLNMTAPYLSVAEWMTRTVGVGEDSSQPVKAPEESDLKAEFDGHSSWEDIEYYCSSDRTLGLPLTARLFPLILSILWAVRAEME